MIYAVIDTNVFVVALEKRDDDSYLVTGNQKHYPVRDDGHFESMLTSYDLLHSKDFWSRQKGQKNGRNTAFFRIFRLQRCGFFDIIIE